LSLISNFLFNNGTLHRVEKPSRYTGAEYNQRNINKESEYKIALCFPDLYEVGMSHTGFHILYDLFNKFKDLSTERVFLPWFDMIDELEKNDIPLYSLESFNPIKNFDILGITLQYELCYTNVLKILSLSKIPVYSKDRKDDDPIVIAGGPCTSNPEPYADFFDAVYIGDGEVFTENLYNVLKSSKSRKERLNILSKTEGVYVPSLYKMELSEKGYLIPKSLNENVPSKIKIQKVFNLNDYPINTNQIVPNIDIVHNRANVEIMRGCNRGCRFCHAGMFYRPIRERDVETLKKDIYDILNNTGYKELSLLSLSSLDYSKLKDLLESISPHLEENRVSLSLPSSRVDKFGLDISSNINSGRKTGLTFAPEAGSQKMRDGINKGLTEEEIFNVVNFAKSKGWSKLKLYFMIGLPGETDEDVHSIVDLAKNLKFKSKIKDLNINVSIFIPKAHTPFQFASFLDIDSIKRRKQILYDLKKYRINLRIHDHKESFTEAVFAVGDRSLSKVIYDAAFKYNAIFQQSGDNFDVFIWEKLFEEHKINVEKFLNEKDVKEALPWDIIDVLISRNFLEDEWNKSKKELITKDCRDFSCSLCGVCIESDLSNIKSK